jgi:steroid 5-alpha reductase family enzyme
MNIKLVGSLIALSIIACPLLYIFVGPALDASQMETLKVLGMIMCGSAVFCFVVGELTGNNSQMDKLWSLLPIAYTWVIAFRGGLQTRLVVMAVLATLWGLRLTFNFARKGAYRLKFWEGEEDYRWAVLRAKKEFQPHWKWMIFNLFFISIYQNALVLMTTFPALVLMSVDKPFGLVDGLVSALMLGFIVYETIADEQQWAFQTTKWKMIKEGKKLEELPAPYNKGFNTVGLWNVSRHPNYFAEQGTWFAFYLFTIGGGMSLFNWSIIGALLLIVLFLGSSAFAEEISASKYPEYARYCQLVSRFFPGKKYTSQSTEKS